MSTQSDVNNRRKAMIKKGKMLLFKKNMNTFKIVAIFSMNNVLKYTLKNLFLSKYEILTFSIH